MQHSMRMRIIVIYDLPHSTIFFHVIPQTPRFSGVGGGKLLNKKMCVFISSTYSVSNISRSTKNSARYIITLHRLSCNVTVIPVRFLRKFNFLDRYLKYTQISNSMKIRAVVVELLFHADRQTDTGGTKSCYSQFCDPA